MSYARFSDTSNVYVYSDVGGYIACCGCILGDKWDFHSVAEIVAHMGEHDDAGHKIPSYLLDPDTYEGVTFVAMCSIFLCREEEGHPGEHTPFFDNAPPNYPEIRENQIAAALSTPKGNTST